eukprot:COSAG04_NODE_2833_length_3518_cov_6.625622_2_plen_195_part_00
MWLGGRRAGLVRAKASREPPREGWCWPGDWRRSGGLSSLAVAAVSRDTMRSSLRPAATFLVVSVTARLSLAELALTDEAAQMAGRHVLGRLQRSERRAARCFPLVRAVPPARKARAPVGGHLNRPKLAEPSPSDISGGRATTCGQRPQRPHGAGRTVSGLWRRAHQAWQAARAVGAGGSSSSSSGASTVAMSFM